MPAMRRRFFTLDVFTATPLAGNPLAVVIDADGLDTSVMQRIAREFNLSETVFVLDSRDPVNTARLRIFTPTSELPFAGHPTIGTAILIASVRAAEMVGRDLQIVLEEEVGPVFCTIRLARQGASHASFIVPRLPERIGDAGSVEALAVALSLQPRDIGFDNHRPEVWSAGAPFCFVPVASLEAIARAAPAPGLAAAVGAGRGAFLYTRETADADNAIHARMFGVGVGIAEDPATGSAVAAFAGLATAFERPEDGAHSLVIEQGFEMGRPSLIKLGLEIENGRLIAATIGGSAVRVSEGTIDV
jgi:trans-2,3-dihydro-3-hydroxyanthranilate isomerase